MKSVKYLNAVLTVIAVCLVVITMSVSGLIPKASANDNNKRYVSVPLNDDGSINVKIDKADVLDVNIESCDGTAFNLAEPIEVKIKE
jgi:hypothetical protein